LTKAANSPYDDTSAWMTHQPGVEVPMPKITTHYLEMKSLNELRDKADFGALHIVD